MSTEFTDTEHTTYDLQGRTLSDVAEEIAGKEESAKAEWFPSYTYTTTGQQLGTAEVIVRTKITMPRWSSYDSAQEADQREWDRFFSALQAHEQGHVDLVLQHLTKIDEQLLGQSPSGAAEIWRDALDTLKAASDAYDHDTDHGRNQGTIIDLNDVTPSVDSN
jgi:predicted secreted Zn-dependent protease